MSENESSVPGKGARIAGLIIGIIPCLLLLLSAAMKFIQPTGFDEGLLHLGWSAGKMKALGVVEIVVTLLYLFPRTSVLGAIVITGYMGGAVATHARVDDLFVGPIIVGVLIWLALYLRDIRVRQLLPVS